MALRVAFLGCGGIANAHMRSLAKAGGGKMVAFCDADEARAAKAAQDFGGKPYTEFDKMLQAEALDVLWVCLPPFAHEGQEIKAARKGIHLFVEKPVSLSMDYAGEVAKAIAKAGILSCVGYQIRYCPHVTEARKILKGHRIDMVAARYMCDMTGMKGWWPVMAKSGGQVVEQSTHALDLMRYLAGDVLNVYARYAQRAVVGQPHWDVPDNHVLAMDLACGGLATLHSSASIGGWDAGVRIFCDDLDVDCTFSALRVVRGNETREIRSAGDPMVIQDGNFLAAIRKGRQDMVRSSYADAVKTLAVTLAANESAAKGQPVSL